MNPQTVLTCSKLCAASYDDTDNRFITVDELRFGVIIQDGITYLVFRGTDNLQGWIDDFTVIPARTMGGYLAHEGFIEAIAKLWDSVTHHLIGTTGPWVITGHSLGGALAMLSAEQLKGGGDGQLIPVVTFGCPRVYSRLNETTPLMDHTRVASDDDPVPDVPDVLAWQHLCDPVTLKSGEIINPKDHSIDVYIKRWQSQEMQAA